MLTNGIERDILLDHHIAVARLELSGQRNRRVLRHPAEDLFTHSRNPVRRVLKTFPCGIFPDSFQEQGYCLFDFLFVHLTLSFRRVLSIGIQKSTSLCGKTWINCPFTIGDVSYRNGCGKHIARYYLSFRGNSPSNEHLTHVILFCCTHSLY